MEKVLGPFHTRAKIEVSTQIEPFFENLRFQIPLKLRFRTSNRDFVACIGSGEYQAKGISSFHLKLLRGGILTFFHQDSIPFL